MPARAAYLAPLYLLGGCAAPEEKGQETAETGVPAVDADGDGFPRWDGTEDPARADCDDADASVTPATEVYVAEGSFIRGSTDSPFAAPVREVTLSAYCVDVTEVTNEAFVPFLEARRAETGGYADELGREPYKFDDHDDVYAEHIVAEGDGLRIEAGYERHPVVEVYHWGAEQYCAWAGGRLPTEAEWEKAARGVDGREFPWGPTIDCAHANYRESGTPGPDAVYCVGDTAAVGTLPAGASPYGALDMSGNASEWVSDWFQDDYYDAAPDHDPTGPADGLGFFDEAIGARITRGGNFLLAGAESTVHFRYIERETAASNGVGFRCVRAPR